MSNSEYIGIALAGLPLLVLGLLTSPFGVSPASGAGLVLSAAATVYGAFALGIAVVRP